MTISARRSLPMCSASAWASRVFQQLAPDGEAARADLYRGLALAADGLFLRREQAAHMLGAGRRADGGDGLDRRQPMRRRQDGGAAQAVADQQPGGAPLALQRRCGGQQIVHVRREIGIGEVALAAAQPGEVEAQYRDAALCQRLADAPRPGQVLAAGKAVRKEREGPVGARAERRQ
jgi:hypothetical protein